MSGGWRELIGHYKCGCGAIYRKTFTTTPFDADDADCEVCGKRMDGWYNTTGFRSFELISWPGAQTLSRPAKTNEPAGPSGGLFAAEEKCVVTLPCIIARSRAVRI
jgi:hypothetical protein